MAGKTSKTARVREQDYVAGSKALSNAMPHLPWPSTLSPSGLVPAICNHGLRALLPDHPPVGRMSRIDPITGGDLPYNGGNSWVRSRYVDSTFKCVICRGAERPADFTSYRA